MRKVRRKIQTLEDVVNVAKKTLEVIEQSWAGTPRSVVPYGVCEHPIEQGRILLTRYLRRHGLSVGEITGWLNENRQYRRDGGEWSAGQVRYILRCNPADREFKREELPGSREILDLFWLSRDPMESGGK